MDASLHDYHLMLKAADAEMERAIEKMPLSKIEYVINISKDDLIFHQLNNLFLDNGVIGKT